ncbi:MAG: response regulator transcription factor [Pseudomonadota bacterium]
MKVLIVEDDDHLRHGLSVLLAQEGYEPLAAESGSLGLELFTQNQPDFCVLDITLPGLDGFELCREIRQRDAHVPVLFLSARESEIDQVVGLEIGADDFVVKPFRPRELIARVRAIARRRSEEVVKSDDKKDQVPDAFDFAPFQVDTRALRALLGDAGAVDLSRREVRILWLMKQHQGDVVTRDALFDACWGRDYLPNSRALDQQMSVLRRKLEKLSHSQAPIQTVHREGYRFEP